MDIGLATRGQQRGGHLGPLSGVWEMKADAV